MCLELSEMKHDEDYDSRGRNQYDEEENPKETKS
jgi:hypothetical protein